MRGAFLLLLVATPAAAEGERALSVNLGWATFSVPGKPVGNMAPPTLSPHVRGAPRVTFEQGIASTVAWYGSRPEWWRAVKTGAYRSYYERQYGGSDQTVDGVS